MILGGVYMLLSVILLGVAVVMGIGLAIGHFTGERPPLFAVGLVHGIVAIVGVISMIVSISRGADGTAIQTSLVIFLTVVVIGIVMFVLRRQRKALPNALIVVHGLLAVVGYVFLLRGWL
jgi:hypothetical protein